MKRLSLTFLLLLGMALYAAAHNHEVSVERHVTVYADTMYYSAFPSIEKIADGELLCAFRRAPNRQLMGADRYSHIDPNSYLVSVRTYDGGLTWSEPELMMAHPYGGSQDPCMLKLRNGDILCSSYLWIQLQEGLFDKYAGRVVGKLNSTFAGGYLIRSTDDGHTWQGPFNPGSPLPVETRSTMLGKLPLYNRGAMYEGRDGIYWAVACDNGHGGSSVYLVTSRDGGTTWDYRSVIADDPQVSFNETSIIETPRGDLVAFIRSFNYDDMGCIARSTDGGKSFTWQSMGFQGHPFHAVPLPDGCWLLTYGYRHEPYGIRARILNPECTDFATAPEIIIRSDGGSTDLGYSWATMIDPEHYLVVYYINFDGDKGVRQILGSILEIK